MKIRNENDMFTRKLDTCCQAMRQRWRYKEFQPCIKMYLYWTEIATGHRETVISKFNIYKLIKENRKMRKTTRKLAVMAGGICMFALAMVAMPSTAKAASAGIKQVSEGKKYTSYDLDSDGKNDNFYIKTSSTTSNDITKGTLKVYVNDKEVFSQTRNYSPRYDVELITLNNGKTFVGIESSISSDDDTIHKLYQYKSGKLNSVYNFQKACESYADYYFVGVEKVSGNSLHLSCMAQLPTTGMVYWNMKVNYTNGAFKRSGSSYAINYKKTIQKNKWTAQRTMKAYKKAGGKKVAYKIKKGNVIKIYNIVFKNNKIYFKVKNKSGKGKTAYLTCSKKFVYPYYFKESLFAG